MKAVYEDVYPNRRDRLIRQVRQAYDFKCLLFPRSKVTFQIHKNKTESSVLMLSRIGNMSLENFLEWLTTRMFLTEGQVNNRMFTIRIVADSQDLVCFASFSYNPCL